MNISWLSNPTVLLGALGTLLGTVGSVWSGFNSTHLSALQAQYQSDRDFATAIHNVAAVLSTHDQDGLHAMVEFSSLYADTETVPHKLVLIEMAQTAGQETAMIALSDLAGSDVTIQHPSESDVLAANSIKYDINKFANAEFQKAAASPAPLAKSTSTVPAVPANDPPLTQSKDALVRANASLVAAVPLELVSGWVFVGDASGSDRHKSGALLDARTDAISSKRVPAAGTLVSACQDLNIRQKPFQNGALGPIVGIAPRGSIVVVDSQSGGNQPLSADTNSAIPPHNPITAWWIHVTLQQTPAGGTQASASAKPATASQAASATPSPC